MSVHFDELDAFFIEMERDARDGFIQNKIVRRVLNRTIDGATVPDFTLVVGYVARGQLVECTARRGKVWGRSEATLSPSDQRVTEQLDADRKAIVDFCIQHGLDLRGGRFT